MMPPLLAVAAAAWLTLPGQTPGRAATSQPSRDYAKLNACQLVRGEAIKAFVVLQAGAQLTAAEITAHCANRLANYMVPKEIVFIDRLPINAHGKIMKTELRKLSAPSEATPA